MIREKKPYPQFTANFLLNDTTRACRKRGLEFYTSGVPPSKLNLALSACYHGLIERRTLRAWLEIALDEAQANGSAGEVYSKQAHKKRGLDNPRFAFGG